MRPAPTTPKSKTWFRSERLCFLARRIQSKRMVRIQPKEQRSCAVSVVGAGGPAPQTPRSLSHWASGRPQTGRAAALATATLLAVCPKPKCDKLRGFGGRATKLFGWKAGGPRKRPPTPARRGRLYAFRIPNRSRGFGPCQEILSLTNGGRDFTKRTALVVIIRLLLQMTHAS